MNEEFKRLISGEINLEYLLKNKTSEELLDITADIGRNIKSIKNPEEMESILKIEIEILDILKQEFGDKLRVDLSLVHAYGQLGRSYKFQSRFTEAIECKTVEVKLLEGLEGKFNEKNRAGQLRYAYSYLGNLTRKIGDKKSVMWMEKELKLLEKIKEDMDIKFWEKEYAYCLGRLSWVYKNINMKKSVKLKKTELGYLENLEGYMNEVERRELISGGYLSLGLYEKENSEDYLVKSIENSMFVLDTGNTSKRFIESCKKCARELSTKGFTYRNLVNEFLRNIETCEQNMNWR